MKKRILAILLCLALTTAVMPAAAFADGDAPEITSINLTHGYDYVKYSFDIQSKNTVNAEWSVSGGTLPDGLTLNPGTGTISGTPTNVGSWTFKVTVTTSAGSDDHEFTIVIVDSPFIQDGTLPGAESGTAYSQTVNSGQHSDSSISWSVVDGKLPAGLELDPAAGLISGTPTEGGTYTFTVQAKWFDGAIGTISPEKEFTITVDSAEPVITPDTTEPTVSDETGTADSSDITTVSQTAGTVTVAQSTSPETGITGSSSTLWIVLVIVAAAAVITIVVVNKRKKKDSNK